MTGVLEGAAALMLAMAWSMACFFGGAAAVLHFRITLDGVFRQGPSGAAPALHSPPETIFLAETQGKFHLTSQCPGNGS